MEKITLQQENFISEFTCERLTSDLKNKELIQCFENTRNKSLALKLKTEAWNEDCDGINAYYIIKYHGEIALYFSLQCGALFRPFDESKFEQELKKIKDTIAPILYRKDCTKKVKRKQQIKDTLKLIEMDRVREFNKLIYRVQSTHAGIELVHFCANEDTIAKIDNPIENHTIGEMLFWRFLVPKVLEIKELIGCQYLFLFAADLTESQDLVNYYKVALHFYQPNDISTNKPYYDFKCIFMCQNVNELEFNRNNYFINFNPDKEDIIV